MKRICLFAGYDKNNIIQEDVIYYIKELSTIADVYYMADNSLNKKEKDKLLKYTKGIYGYHHGKYDFGSWQELIYKMGGGIVAYDELILANDSVFGPLYSIRNIIDDIENDNEWDICGITGGLLTPENNKELVNEDTWAITSHFIVLRKKAFSSEIFKNFFQNIKAEKSQKEVIKNYELKFARNFYENGYVAKLFMGYKNVYDDWYKREQRRSNPFIKKKIFVDKEIMKTSKPYLVKLLLHTKHYKYDINLINNFLKINEISFFNIIRYGFFSRHNLKSLRRWLIQIKFNKNQKIIRVLGIYLMNKKNYKNPIPISIIK